MPYPTISPLPPAPSRSDAPDDFTSKADAFVAALPPLVEQINESGDYMDQQVASAADSADTAANSASSAAFSAGLAADQAELATTNGQEQVQLAADQVQLAANQVALANNARDAAEDFKDSAEAAAAAAGSAAGLPALAGNAGKVLQVSADEQTVLFGDTDISLARSVRTSNIQITKTDKSTFIDITSGTFSQTFASAAALGNGWFCYIRNSGSGDITLDPNGSETIDGRTSFIMYPGEVRLLQCDGVVLRSIVLNSFYRKFVSSDMFIKPPGYSAFSLSLWGGGYGGGGSSSNTGPGGHGASRIDVSIAALQVGESTIVIIGSGGIGSAGKAPNNNPGLIVPGGETSFGSYFSTQGYSSAQGSLSIGGLGGLSASGTPGNAGSSATLGGGGGGSGGGADTTGSSGPGGAGGTSKTAGNGGAGGASASSNEDPGNGKPGSDGEAPGGGGGGGGSGKYGISYAYGGKGGNGARGELRIWGVI